MQSTDLQNNGMMKHLLDALQRGEDIGHYGRLTFVMVARHFMDDEQLVQTLSQDKDFSEEQARAMVQQVQERGYNPPRPDRIAEWQSEQAFPICPSDDPDACNVYRDLKFPDGVYHHIEEYREAKAHANH